MGGSGNDTIEGGTGRDVMSGGSGTDVFVIGAGDSGVGGLATIDAINDWTSADRIEFGDAAGSGTNYAEATAADFAAAVTAAEALMDGTVIYVAVAIGSDVVVFYDDGGNGTADESVLLVGKTLADIGETNIL